MAIHLVRHASAVSRASWSGNDDERPLDVLGKRQSNELAERLSDQPVSLILSSVSVRCVETVEPLAAVLGLTVETTHLLYEGGEPVDALSALIEHDARAAGDVVACSHGDLIPKIIRHLAGEGMRVKGNTPCEKASVWELRVHDGKVVEGIYHQPGG